MTSEPGLLVVTGPPGAGKSTVSAILAAAADQSILVEGDRFFGFLAEGAIEPWLPESHQQNLVVTEAAAVAAGRFAITYYTVYDGVVGPWFLPAFFAATGLSEIDYVVLLPSLEDCLKRVRTRTGHEFTDEAAATKMHSEFAGVTIDQRHILAGHPTDPAASAESVATARAAGQLRYRISR